MKSLKQLKQDDRISEIEILSDSDESKYLVWLADGWVYDDGTHVNGFNTVAEINNELKLLEKESTNN